MIVVKPQYCPQNHHCPTVRTCPVGAIRQDGRGAPTVDQTKCIECGRCTEACPVFRLED